MSDKKSGPSKEEAPKKGCCGCGKPANQQPAPKKETDKKDADRPKR